MLLKSVGRSCAALAMSHVNCRVNDCGIKQGLNTNARLMQNVKYSHDLHGLVVVEICR